jgi:hypothetical protein
MFNCCTSDCSAKTKSHLGFFVAMFLVVAIGGAAYLYLDNTVFAPVDAQQQTALNNPGLPHPPKSKMPGATAPAKPRVDAASDGK